MYHFNTDQYLWLEEGVLPLVPMERKFNIIRAGKEKKTITRQQLPLTAAYAFTDYRSQGQTIENVIVDIGHPPTGELTPFNAYVALSQSRGRETIRLLRASDAKLFTTHPSEHLRKEDERLDALDKLTMEWW
ncbi:hypothetical protein L210DRAFT_964439 [Boletus edulis BED1]|uniref:UvrD-like helicase C-terminal domain-containing protein n=1 Tax=Boletus edulis BED1 TaxID=1328754 RepID=A0AAD4C9C2_BOLED|nr:hypothetical protein L210DRAFT_964439 [Boletus edulis BED1]